MRNLLIGFVLAIGALSLVVHSAAPTVAQQAGALDTWSGQDDRLAALASTTVTSSTQFVAAISGRKLAVKAIDINCDTAGVIQFQDGSGGTTLGAFYLAANTPRTIYEDLFGKGMVTTSGNGVFVIGPSGGKLTGTIRYQAK